MIARDDDGAGRQEQRRGVVVWITGLPSSGKSTLAAAVGQRLERRGIGHCVLDGDAVRDALVPAPGYSQQARDEFYATLGRLAAMLAAQGLVVLVPATAHKAMYRLMAREIAPQFIEVFIAADATECARRDAKGLYRAAGAGQIAGLPGADLAYEHPANPDIVALGGEDADAVDRIQRWIEQL